MFGFFIIHSHLTVMDKKLIVHASKSLIKAKAQSFLQKQLLKIFEALEEAIITTTTSVPENSTTEEATSKLHFRNSKFDKILEKMRGIDTSPFLKGEKQDQLMSMKIFKTCRYYDESNNEFEGENEHDIGTTYSISQIINMPASFLSSRIFQIVYDQQQ